MDLKNLENLTTKIIEAAKETKPMEETVKTLSQKIEKIREETEEMLLKELNANSALLFSMNDLKEAILNTIKNSVTTKTGRIIIEVEKRKPDSWGINKIGLTQKYFSFLYKYQKQIKYDADIDDLYYIPSSETFEIRRDTNPNNIDCSFPKSALTNFKIIDKKYVDKFGEFLVEYNRLKGINADEDESKYIYNKNGIDIFLNNDWNWNTKKYYVKINLDINWNKTANLTPEIAKEIKLGAERIINRNKQAMKLLDEVNRFNAGKNLLRALRQ